MILVPKLSQSMYFILGQPFCFFDRKETGRKNRKSDVLNHRLTGNDLTS